MQLQVHFKYNFQNCLFLRW